MTLLAKDSSAASRSTNAHQLSRHHDEKDPALIPTVANPAVAPTIATIAQNHGLEQWPRSA